MCLNLQRKSLVIKSICSFFLTFLLRMTLGQLKQLNQDKQISACQNPLSAKPLPSIGILADHTQTLGSIGVKIASSFIENQTFRQFYSVIPRHMQTFFNGLLSCESCKYSNIQTMTIDWLSPSHCARDIFYRPFCLFLKFQCIMLNIMFSPSLFIAEISSEFISPSNHSLF